MKEDSVGKKIDFDVWAATPIEVRQVLLALRMSGAAAARLDRKIDKWESNPKKPQHNPESLSQAVGDLYSLLHLRAEAAEAHLSDGLRATLPSATLEALSALRAAAAATEPWRDMLAEFDDRRAAESDALSQLVAAARQIINDLSCAAEAIDPVFFIYAELDENCENAAVKLLALRVELENEIGYWGSSSPREDVDKVLDRVAARLESGLKIRNLRQFCRGTAWRLRMEQARRERFIVEAVPETTVCDPVAEERRRNRDEEHDRAKAHRRACMKKCYSELPPETRQLLRDYYDQSPEPCLRRIERRRMLAAKMGLDRQKLINRVSDIRKKLLKCLTACMKEDWPPSL